MATTVIRFIDLLLVALLAGTTVGIWLGFDPAGLSATAYVEQQQHAIRALNGLLPAVGAVCIVLTLILAVAAKRSPRARYLLFASTAFMVVAAVVTRFGNQPINAQVITWTTQAPPPNWSELRDWWWQWHTVRTVAMVAALAMLILATITGRASSR
ncbi:MAG: anthrone oxygenase family protein [Candidatus Levyibacteriota bacterium]